MDILTDVQRILSVVLKPQQTRMWCWAASGQMVMEFIGNKTVPQCEHASYYFNNLPCCDSLVKCVNGGWPQLKHYGFTFNRTRNQAISWEELTDQIDNGKPICFSWHWNDGGGHMMVVIGYEIQDQDRIVWINNPWEVNKGDTYQITYEAFVKGNGHTHWDDFYNIALSKEIGV